MTDVNSIYGRLQKVFEETFDEMEVQVGPETVASDIAEWDSFNHINLTLAIESEFNIKFTSAEVQNLDTVGRMVTLIAEKVARG
jgi:acyl carrier protein